MAGVEDLASHCDEGIMTGEEAARCGQYGAKAVVVSNHGARQLDTTFATVEVLPEVVDAVDGQVEVYMDGGIRRGSDIVKAVALGARAVLIGRPLFWGLAVDGGSRSPARSANSQRRIGDDDDPVWSPHIGKPGPDALGLPLPPPGRASTGGRRF